MSSAKKERPVGSSPSPAAPAGTTGRHSHGDTHVHEVKFTAYPKLLFIWPLILAGLIFFPIAKALNPDALEVLGWIYITIAVFVILALGVDVSRNFAIFWAVLVFACWISGLYLNAVKNVPVFGWIFAWFGGMDVQYNGSFGLPLSIILLIPFIIMIIYARLNDRWRITHNEFEHYSFGKMDEALGRGAKTIRTEFPDVFEMILGMAGTLIVYSASGSQEIRRIPHVMFLPMRRAKLNKILERVAITTVHGGSEEEEQAV